MDELLREFIAETNEHLAIFERDLVALGRVPDDGGLVNDIFRNVHSIKGTCSFLGLKRLESLLHATENVLGKLRDEALPAASIATSMLFGACTRAKAIVAALAQDGHEPEGGDADIIARLELAMRPCVITSAAMPVGATQAAIVPAPPTNALRGNFDMTDRLMAEASELVSARNQLMQPIGQAWTKLPRMLRDLARDLGKKLELKLEGSEIELDREVLELVKDPFTHLMRNAADHGIETPAERRCAGKAETGIVTLSARREDNAIVITLTDDGRGIDPERIRSAICRGGFATDAELSVMTEHQVLQFIFHPGFTTAAQVTHVSGRGVGLDVVRSNVEKIRGNVEVASNAGRGTRFTIKIPLTLTIVPTLLLDCGGQRFAIPQTAVVELVRTGAENRIEWIHDAPVLRLRSGLLPVVALGDALRLGNRPIAEEEQLIVIIGCGAQRFGIMVDGADGADGVDGVDGVDDAEEVVVKSFAPTLREMKLFTGNTILGDGSVVPILDPSALATAIGVTDSGHTSVANDAAHSDDAPLAAWPRVQMR
jgi:two-component system chemotaxis sensor kinase CheA